MAIRSNQLSLYTVVVFFPTPDTELSARLKLVFSVAGGISTATKTREDCLCLLWLCLRWGKVEKGLVLLCKKSADSILWQRGKNRNSEEPESFVWGIFGYEEKDGGVYINENEKKSACLGDLKESDFLVWNLAHKEVFQITLLNTKMLFERVCF